MVHFGIEYSPEFPFMTGYDCTNEELAQMIEEVASPKLVPWCWIDPLLPDPVKQAEYWVRERGMRGIKMYPPMGWYPNDARVIPVYQFAEEMNIPVLLHMGRIAPHPQLRSKYGRPICLEEVGLAAPKLKLLIGHFAPMWESEAYHIAAGFKNFFFDLTSSGALEPGVAAPRHREPIAGPPPPRPRHRRHRPRQPSERAGHAGPARAAGIQRGGAGGHGV